MRLLPPRYPVRLVLVAGGALYPFLAYAALRGSASGFVVVFGLALLALRLAFARQLRPSREELTVLALAGLVVLGLLPLSPPLAAKAYPTAISFAFAALFLLSLLRPPSLVERIARLREPNLTPAGVIYTRRVTAIWGGFLLANGALAAALGAWGSLEVWTLWTGLLSYVAMGALFLGEYVVRRRVLG